MMNKKHLCFQREGDIPPNKGDSSTTFGGPPSLTGEGLEVPLPLGKGGKE